MSEVAEAPIVEGEALAALSISGIIRLMRKDWKATSKKGIYFGAVPYLDALGTLESLSESYGMDTGKGMVPYLLSNATTYRGAQAKAIKAELKKRAGIK
jgi:hypothetical protein